MSSPWLIWSKPCFCISSAGRRSSLLSASSRWRGTRRPSPTQKWETPRRPSKKVWEKTEWSLVMSWNICLPRALQIPDGVTGDSVRDRTKTFTYDFSYDSGDHTSAGFVSQEKVRLRCQSNRRAVPEVRFCFLLISNLTALGPWTHSPGGELLLVIGRFWDVCEISWDDILSCTAISWASLRHWAVLICWRCVQRQHEIYLRYPEVSWDIPSTVICPERSWDFSWDIMGLTKILWAHLRYRLAFLRYRDLCPEILWTVPWYTVRYSEISWDNLRCTEISWGSMKLFQDRTRCLEISQAFIQDILGSWDILKCPLRYYKMSWCVLRYLDIPRASSIMRYSVMRVPGLAEGPRYQLSSHDRAVNKPVCPVLQSNMSCV